MEVRKKRKSWRFWLNLFILLYCIPGIVFYYIQDKLLFHPKALPADYAFHFSRPFDEFQLPLNAGCTIDVVRFLPADTSRIKGSVIYFHGNRNNIEHYAPLTKIFTDHGYDVWMPDYPGFGKSTGELKEQLFYQMANQVYKLVNSRISSDRITVYGKSLGTGFAAYVASSEPVKQLVLETPYYSIPDIVNSYAPIYPTGYMVNFKVPTYQYLSDTKEPTTIFHGTSDGVIFYRRAKKLKKFLKPSDQFCSIEGGKHNNLFDYPVYKQVMDSILNH